MNYWLNLFSPETYENFSRSDRTCTGFRIRQHNQAQKVSKGDRFVCYMTKLSRWVGILEIEQGPFREDTPLFYAEDDPFVVRFRVNPVVWLPKERAVPIHEDHVWNHLTFTHGVEKRSTTWTGKIRSSLNEMDRSDGQFLDDLLHTQQGNGKEYEVDDRQYRRLVTHRVRRLDRVVSVTVPEDASEDDDSSIQPPDDIRESIQIQASLALIGKQMGHHLWVPRSDRGRVEQALGPDRPVTFLDVLPLNYDDTTLKTIEQIDVLWLKGRAIVRAFEVEHTTSVYSGILRMADLLALQPNMDIKLHIVTPEARKDRVFAELCRPVFSFLDRGPLAECCTYLSYDSVRELMTHPHLHHLSASVLEDYTEEAD